MLLTMFCMFNVLLIYLQFLLLQGLEEKMMLTCAQLQECVPNTVEYAKCAPERIGHTVSIAAFFCCFF